MMTRWPQTRTTLTIFWIVVILPSFTNAQQRGRVQPPHKAVPAASQNTAQSQTLNVTVLPFRQSVGSSETASLGAGVSDSISNALKAVSNLVVTDGDIVVQAAAKSDPVRDLSKDDDAILLGTSLNLQFMVTGSYQSIGSQLLIDARVLNVITGRPLPAVTLTASGKFPDEYAAILQQLTGKLLIALRIPVSTSERGNVTGALVAPKTAEAQNAFVRAGQRMREGTPEALAEAIKLFDRCLALDQAFAPAYVAKAEAEVQLLELQKQAGNSNAQLADDAVRDARTAAVKMPQLSRSHRTLARAFNAVGDYGEARTAAERAIRISPNDFSALIAFARAVGQGQIARLPETERAFRLQPGLAFILADLPKVRVVNESLFDIGVTFQPGDSQPAYPVSRISPNGSKIVALLSGKYGVKVESEIGDLDKNYDFVAGKDYTLTFHATDVPTATAIAHNRGNVTGYLTFQGPKTRTVAIEPGSREEVLLSPGQYTITIAATAGGAPLKTQYENLRPGARLTLEFGITQRIVQRPVYKKQ
jgi:TolB-like protein